MRTPASLNLLARASALLVASLCGPAVQAAVSVGGDFYLLGGGSIGPGDTSLPQSRLGLGASGGIGRLDVDGGSFLQLANIYFDQGRSLIDGAGSRLLLTGDGSVQTGYQRLSLGNNAGRSAALTVSNGGLLDTSTQLSGCLAAFHYCDTYVGSRAGANAEFTVTGAGSVARIGSSLYVGHPGLFVNEQGEVFGRQAATVTALVQVLDGGTLSTDRAQVGTAQWDTFNTGSERSSSRVLVSGASSRWLVNGGMAWNADSQSGEMQGATVSTAADRLAVATIDIEQGGVMRFAHVTDRQAVLNLTTNGGRTDMTVRGAGSAIRFDGTDGVLQVGRRLGSARLQLVDGGQATGLYYTSVGRDGSFGELLVDGTGSLLRMDAIATRAAVGSGFGLSPGLDVGRNGTGSVTVSGGGRIEVAGSTGVPYSPSVSVARDAGSSGHLTITGAGSVLSVTAASVLPGGGAAEAYNPWLRIGRDGNGTLDVLAGGQLLVEGGAVSTVSDQRVTSLVIGGSSDTVGGGKGIATVSGAGSLLKVSGSDALINVGQGPNSFGSLTVSDQARVATTALLVGRSGGTGQLTVDNARVELSGQFTGDTSTGAVMVVGRSGGTGTLNLRNGATLLLSNPGNLGASLSLGGSRLGPGGDGTVNLSGGSLIKVEAAPGLGSVTVGRDGTGLMRVRGASTVDVGDGNLLVARNKGSDGTLLVSEGSQVTAGWVGVGRNREGDTALGSDGGTGTVVLTNSTLTAPQIVVGTNGFLGGSGTIVGNVVNYGIFSPGNSPGTVTIQGDYTAAAGSRLILEVQADGQGGFLTDQVLFAGGGQLALDGLKVEFRFLGNTNPDSFRSAGLFDIDTFLHRTDGLGGLSALPDSAFDHVAYSARSDAYRFINFDYSAGAAPQFTLAPAVPEPGTWALMLAGGAVLGWFARRRRAA